MANNRLYIVDTLEKEYLCIAKHNGTSWIYGNIDLYKDFLQTRFSDSGNKTDLILGTENDNDFYNKWLNDECFNFNTTNKWE